MEHTLWKDFGSWLREQREKSKLSQSGAAQRAEIDRQQWYRIENGLSGTKRETVIRLARAVSADPGEALQRAGFAADPEQPLQQKPPQTVQEFLERIRELGVDFDPTFFGGVESLPDDPDLLQDILNDFTVLLEVRLRKTLPKHDPTTGSGLLPR